MSRCNGTRQKTHRALLLPRARLRATTGDARAEAARGVRLERLQHALAALALALRARHQRAQLALRRLARPRGRCIARRGGGGGGGGRSAGRRGAPLRRRSRSRGCGVEDRRNQDRHRLVPLGLVPPLKVDRHEHDAVKRAANASAARARSARLLRIRDHDRLVPLPLLVHRIDVRADAPLQPSRVGVLRRRRGARRPAVALAPRRRRRLHRLDARRARRHRRQRRRRLRAARAAAHGGGAEVELRCSGGD